MVGYSTTREALPWVQTTEEARVKFEYWTLDNPSQKHVTEEITTRKEDAFVAKVTVGGLSPGKKYGYELFIDDKHVARPYKLALRAMF